MTDQYHQLRGQRPLVHPDRDKIENQVRRVCSECGFKSMSVVPPVFCPQCHWQPDGKSPLIAARPMANRREKRAHARQLRLQQRKTQKQIARETAKTDGKYEAS